MSTPQDRLTVAVAALRQLEGDQGLTYRITAIEHALRGVDRTAVEQALVAEGIGDATLTGALEIKRLAGQVNVAIHAVGILTALPRLLEEGEIVEELSLGAGNTGRNFDLVTDRRIAEFKFIQWRGGPEAIRQNSLFVDLINLAEADTPKLRMLYVTDLVHPLRFLQGRRAIESVLSKNAAVARRFAQLHGDRYLVVQDYWEDVKHRVDLIDVTELVPALSTLPPAAVGDDM